MSKESLTGYMNRSNEGGKLENLIYCQKGSVYYLPSFGTDRELFLESSFPLQDQSFVSYLRQVALVNGIVTASIDVTQQDFTQMINYKIASEEEQQSFNGLFSGGGLNV